MNHEKRELTSVLAPLLRHQWKVSVERLLGVLRVNGYGYFVRKRLSSMPEHYLRVKPEIRSRLAGEKEANETQIQSLTKRVQQINLALEEHVADIFQVDHERLPFEAEPKRTLAMIEFLTPKSEKNEK